MACSRNGVRRFHLPAGLLHDIVSVDGEGRRQERETDHGPTRK
jgi:hypothetical protein